MFLILGMLLRNKITDVICWATSATRALLPRSGQRSGPKKDTCLWSLGLGVFTCLPSDELNPTRIRICQPSSHDEAAIGPPFGPYPTLPVVRPLTFCTWLDLARSSLLCTLRFFSGAKLTARLTKGEISYEVTQHPHLPKLSVPKPAVHPQRVLLKPSYIPNLSFPCGSSFSPWLTFPLRQPHFSSAVVLGKIQPCTQRCVMKKSQLPPQGILHANK